MHTAQLIGFFAFLFTLLGFMQKNDTTLKRLLAVGSLLWTIHYYLLGAETAALITIIISIRQFLASIVDIQTKSKMKNFLFSIFMGANIIILYYTWQGYISILPFLASTIATIGMFFVSGIALRKTILGAEASWFAHNLYFVS